MESEEMKTNERKLRQTITDLKTALETETEAWKLAEQRIAELKAERMDAAAKLSPTDACELSLAVKRVLSRIAELELKYQNAFDRAEDMRRREATQRQRAEAAEKVVEKLPKTADGVPVVPGMRLWSPGYTEQEEDGSEYTHDPSKWPEPVSNSLFMFGTNKGSTGPNKASEYYSTREAAEAATKGGASDD